MMNKTNGEQAPNGLQPWVPWLDEETLTEIIPEPVVSTSVGRPELRENKITLVQNESTDDI